MIATQLDLEFERMHPLTEQDENEMHLVCFPPLGGGFFNFVEWVDPQEDGRIAIPQEMSLWATEFNWTDAWTHEALVQALVQAIETRIPNEPIALFGYSYGGLVADDVARMLCQRGIRKPIGLAIGGMCEPHRYHPATDFATDAEWRAELERIGGTPPEVLSNPTQLRLLVRDLRGGLRIAGTYHPQEWAHHLNTAVFSGKQDPDFSPESVYDWFKRTTGVFTAYTDPDAGHIDLLQVPHIRTRFLERLVATMRWWQGGIA